MKAKATVICTAILGLAASFGAAAQDPTARCINGLSAEPRLQTIADKVALGHDDRVFAMRVAADRSPSDRERAALAVWLDLRNECFSAGEKYRRSVSKPQERAFVRSVFVFQQRLVADLRAGRLTYTEYNRRRQELAESAGQEI